MGCRVLLGSQWGDEGKAKVIDYLSKDAHVLEIGTGPGTDWELLNSNYKVIGSDNSDEFIKRLISKHPIGEFLNLDAVTLQTDNKFDGIYSNKVMHHLNDDEIEASIKMQYQLLHPAGIICHSFWKGEGSELYNGLFVNYHTSESLIDLIAGQFEILALEHYQEFEEDDSIFTIGRKI